MHIEAIDDDVSSTTFCGICTETNAGSVSVTEWHLAAESIQSATCPECLARVYMLGDSAAIALARLGLKIEVRDATEAETNPS